MKLSILLLFFVPFLAVAQPRITQSQVIKPDGNAEVSGIANETATGNIFLLRHEAGSESRYQWAVDVFSPDLKLLHRNKPLKLDMPGGEDVSLGHAVTLGGKPHLMFLKYRKKDDKTAVYRSTLQSNGAIGKPELAGTLDGTLVESSQLMFVQSADKALFMIAQHPSRNKPNEPFSYIVFDQQGSVRRKGNLSIPKEPSDLATAYPMITNDGAIWLPVWIYDKKLRQEIWIWGESGNQPVKIDIAPADDRIATDVVLRQSAHDGFVYAGGAFAAASSEAEKGMFKAKKWNNDPHPEQGTFVLKMDGKTGAVVSRSAHTFSAATLGFWDKKVEAIKKGDGLNSIRAVDVLPQADGSVWIGLEQFYQIFQSGTINYTPQAIGSLADGFNFGDPCSDSGILAHHAAGGELLQEQVLGKHAWSIGNYGLGYFFRTAANGELVALYTDHAENPGANITREGKLEKALVGGYGNRMLMACGALMTVKQGEAGRSKKIFTQKETASWFEPRLLTQVSDGVYVFACIGKSSDYHLLRLEL